jgi:type I restriction-modification system DNA methylase subunit
LISDISGELLQAAYEKLGYSQGDLQSSSPTNCTTTNIDDWITKGAWLTIGSRVGAEKILFVNNNPVIIFARLNSHSLDSIRNLYNGIWCMARPRLLFIATPGELAVYDLAQPPARNDSDWKEHSPLAMARTIEEVAHNLKKYAREQVETGFLFEDTTFHTLENRADKSLMRDLKTVRSSLMEEGLNGEKVKFAHALIGRSIFIRYLEDKKILTSDYFWNVAKQDKKWTNILRAKSQKPYVDSDMENLIYPRILSDKEFTYALFDKLAHDFNGDMFPQSVEEKRIVTNEHLSLLQSFLRGDVQPQKSLFFFAYRFDIIPLELISNIYEEFYQVESGKQKSQASYYTPPALVDFLLSRVLTKEILSSSPRILDPACGSGVFLVEAFKQIVRYRCHIERKNLTFKELVDILHTQIAGIDINLEVIQVAAFSLYMAMLNHLDPPDILSYITEGNRLPYLIVNSDHTSSLNILLKANTFAIDSEMMPETLKSKFSRECCDVIVTNPPWGDPLKTDDSAREANEIALQWCEQNNKPVGDKERSQTFLWKAIDLLRHNGTGALIISANILFKHGRQSTLFMNQLLSSVVIDDIFNFAHARKLFFKESDAPFAIFIFRNSDCDIDNHVIHYWSAKSTAQVEALQVVLLNKSDLKLVRQTAVLNNHLLWKILWWGTHRDEALINYLSINKRLNVMTNSDLSGQGFKKANRKRQADWLKQYKQLPPDRFTRYGQFNSSWLVEAPGLCEYRGKKTLYEGLRLLVKRGIDQKSLPKGQIVARIESIPFCYSNYIHGIKFTEDEDWRYKCVLGILWSSLARYYFFLTSSDWGIWHDEIRLDELLNLPIRLPQDAKIKNRLIGLVDKLRDWNEADSVLNIHLSRNEDLKTLEKQLDNTVFTLFGLSDSEINLIKDFCDIGLDYFYLGFKSDAGKPIVSANQNAKSDEIKNYVDAFLETWNTYLESDTEFAWHVIAPRERAMIAVILKIREKTEGTDINMSYSQNEWDRLLTQDNLFRTPFGSRNIYIDGLVRIVTNKEIIIIKRNERRLWTRSLAREDADATLTQAMNRDSLIRSNSN